MSLKRSGLQRTAALRRARRKKARVSPETLRVAFARTGGACAAGCGRRAEDPHHCFPKQASRWPNLVDVPENVIGLCRSCHAEHEAVTRRIPRSAIACAEGLVRDYRMAAYLDRVYGPAGIVT